MALLHVCGRYSLVVIAEAQSLGLGLVSTAGRWLSSSRVQWRAAASLSRLLTERGLGCVAHT